MVYLGARCRGPKVAGSSPARCFLTTEVRRRRGEFPRDNPDVVVVKHPSGLIRVLLGAEQAGTNNQTDTGPPRF